MRTFISVAMICAVTSVAACQKKPIPEPPPVEVFKALPLIPFPPGADPLLAQRAQEAAQLTFASTEPVDTVVNYYRDLFAKPPYRLINENTASGVTAFYVEKDGPSMWVTVQKNGDAGSMVTIAGAVRDTNLKAPVLPPVSKPVHAPPK